MMKQKAKVNTSLKSNTALFTILIMLCLHGLLLIGLYILNTHDSTKIKPLDTKNQSNMMMVSMFSQAEQVAETVIKQKPESVKEHVEIPIQKEKLIQPNKIIQKSTIVIEKLVLDNQTIHPEVTLQASTQIQKLVPILASTTTENTNKIGEKKENTINLNIASSSSLNINSNTKINQSAKIQGNCPKDIPYPNTAYRLQHEGTVALKMLVNILGKGEQIEVILSSNSSYLDNAARQAFLKCIFKPAMSNGITQSAWVSKSYTFKLIETD